MGKSDFLPDFGKRFKITQVNYPDDILTDDQMSFFINFEKLSEYKPEQDKESESEICKTTFNSAKNMMTTNTSMEILEETIEFTKKYLS